MISMLTIHSNRCCLPAWLGAGKWRQAEKVMLTEHPVRAAVAPQVPAGRG